MYGEYLMVESVKNHVSSNKNLYKNAALVVGGYLVARLVIKKVALTPVEYKSKSKDKELNIKTNLTNKDKERIREYFNNIESFLDGYFFKKYSSYFKGIEIEDKDKLKLTHETQDLNKIIFPVSYYKIQENSDLVSFLKKICSELGIETQAYEYEGLVKEIKSYYKINSHRKILDEIKNYISEKDYENWQKLYDSKPVSILN